MNRHEEIAKLKEMVRDIDIAKMTTVEADGSLPSRTMSTQQSESDGDHWFFSYAYTPKVEEIQRDRRVNLCYASNEKNTWISVSGAAYMARDAPDTKELWAPILEA